jgi:hypothetical protein
LKIRIISAPALMESNPIVELRFFLVCHDRRL